MGLKVNYIDKTGIQLNYWNLLSIDLSVADNVNGLNIVLRGYPNYELRQSYKALRELKLHFNNAKEILKYPANNIYSAIYGLIKTLPEFQNAEDVLEKIEDISLVEEKK